MKRITKDQFTFEIEGAQRLEMRMKMHINTLLKDLHKLEDDVVKHQKYMYDLREYYYEGKDNGNEKVQTYVDRYGLEHPEEVEG